MSQRPAHGQTPAPGVSTRRVRSSTILTAVAATILAGCAVVSPSPGSPSPPAATDPPAGSRTVTVSTVPALLDALADDSIDTVVVADGTYHVTAASEQNADSLWIGARYAGRTRPITVRAQTRGGVTFDGGGATYFGCISFEQGVHDQTWDGFNCAGGEATQTGVITFGGFGLTEPGAPNHITLRNITILSSCTGSSTTATSPTLDHAFYMSNAPDGGPHDLLFEDITVDGRGGLASAFHFFHSTADAPNASNVTIRRLHVVGTQQAIILFDPTLRNITIDSADITDALLYAVRYELTGAEGIVLSHITSTGSGSGAGFFSSEGAAPHGIKLQDVSLR